MQQVWKHYFAIIFVAAIIFFVNLGGPRLWDRDETRNARCTVEMLERGDWVVPYYNGQVRDIKPVGMYWFMMSAVGIFGPTEFAFRFWSAVAGIGTALITYHLGRRLFNPTVGLWAGLILASSLMFAVLARAAKVDTLLIFFDTLALAVFVYAVFRSAADPQSSPQLREPDRYYPKGVLPVIAMFALMGLAVLGKGPIGFVLPTAVIGMFLLIVRLPDRKVAESSDWHEPKLRFRTGSLLLVLAWLAFGLLLTKISLEFGIAFLVLLAIHLFYRPLPIFRPFAPVHFFSTCWYMRPLTAIVVIAAVALPWHIWVAQRDIEWIRGFYLTNNIGRATTALENHGGSDLLYYPITIALGFAPWSAFLIPMLIEMGKRIKGNDRWRTGYILVACWAGVYIGMFSLAKTKLPNYILPCYPALALMAAGYIYYLRDEATKAAAWWPRVSMVVMAVVGIGLAVGLPIATQIYLGSDQWLGLVGLLPLSASLICLEMFRRGKPRFATTFYAAFGGAFVLALVAGVAQQVDRHQHFHVMTQAIFNQTDDPRIGTYKCLEPSWVHYTGRNIREFRDDASEVRRFLEEGANRYVITRTDQWDVLEPELPPDAAILAECQVLLKQDRLLLIGRETNSISTARRTDRQSSIRK